MKFFFVVLGEPVHRDIITLNDAENYSVMILLIAVCVLHACHEYAHRHKHVTQLK